MHIVFYTSSSDLHFTIPIWRKFNTKKEALDFIEKVQNSDKKLGVTRTIEYLGEEEEKYARNAKRRKSAERSS